MSYVRGSGTAVRGMGQSNVNSTTMFIPGTGPGSGFLATPGNASTASGGAAVYQAPTYTPPPACSSGPPGTSDSPECIALLLQTQQNNMSLANSANYNVDESDCVSNLALNNAQRTSEGLPTLPNTCGDNTFDLVPTGGYTGNTAGVSEDANGNPVLVTPTSVSGAAPNPYVPNTAFTIAPTVPAPNTAPTSTTNGSNGSTTDGSSSAGIVSSAASFFGSDVDIAGEEIPVWGLLAAGVALLFFMGGRH